MWDYMPMEEVHSNTGRVSCYYSALQSVWGRVICNMCVLTKKIYTILLRVSCTSVWGRVMCNMLAMCMYKENIY